LHSELGLSCQYFNLALTFRLLVDELENDPELNTVALGGSHIE